MADAGAHAFAAQVPVDQGDRLALVVAPGGAYGLAAAEGTGSRVWAPALRGAIVPPDTGPAGEVLLRADFAPGGAARLPVSMGARAAGAPAGRVLTRRPARPAGRPPLEVRVAMVGGHGVLDVLRDGRRLDRIAVPGLREPRGDVLIVDPDPDPASPGYLGINVLFTADESDRLVRHYYGYVSRLEYVN